MVRVSGTLVDFVEDPSIVAQVQVRASEVRPHGDGVMLDHPVKVDYAPSTGAVTFDAAAGTAGVIMWHAVGRSHASGSLPIVVPDGDTATLRECVELAWLRDGTDGTLEAITGGLSELAETIINSILGGLAPSMGSVNIPAGTDWDSLTEARFYHRRYSSPSASPDPNEPTNANGVLLVGDSQNPTGRMHTHLYIATSGTGIFYRSQASSGAWSAWVDLAAAPRAQDDLDAAVSHVGHTSDIHAGKLVRLDSTGGLVVSTSSITELHHPTNRGYVDSAISGLWNEFAPLQSVNIPAGTDWDSLTEARFYHRRYSSPSASPDPNEPTNANGVLLVGDSQNPTGRMHTHLYIATSGTGIFYRSQTSSGAWSAWVDLAAAQGSGQADPNHMEHGSARRAALVDGGLRRRGMVIGTGGLPAVALRFDHHLDSFGDKIMPLLRKYRLPWGQAINGGNIGTGDDNWTWNRLAAECHETGGEVWNHGATHISINSAEEADSEITGGMTILKENLPSLWIDGWAPPGQSNYFGMESFNSPEDHWDSYPGRLVLAQHAFIRGYFWGQYEPLAGPALIGSRHITMDYTSVSYVTSLVQGAIDTGSGITLMLHPNYVDQEGYNSLANIEAMLKFVADKRDAGEIVVLSNTGILMADIDRPRRNLLAEQRGPGTVTDWSVTVRQEATRGMYGVPHEAEVWVTGAGEATLTVTVDSATFPVTESHTVTLSHIPQRMSVLLTPPLDTTITRIDIYGAVTHQGVAYRPI